MTSAGRVAARDQLPRKDTRHTQQACPETEAGTTEGIRCTAPGESVLIKLLVVSAAPTREGTKRRPNQVCVFVEYLKT